MCGANPPSAGHFQFIDARGGVMDAICATGAAPDASVAALTQAALVAWAETMVRGDPTHVDDPAGSSSASGGSRGAAQAAGEQQVPPRLRMGLDADGQIVAGLASWDAASRLFSTAQQARQLLSEGARKGRGTAAGSNGRSGGDEEEGGQLEFSVRLKNFQLLFGDSADAGEP